MSVELKIKNKHLAEEARIIKFQERKLIDVIKKLGCDHKDYYKMNMQYHSLNDHRRWDVRNENRATGLARAFLVGKPYAKVENARREEKEYMFKNVILPRVLTMVNKYGDEKVDIKAIEKWCELS